MLKLYGFKSLEIENEETIKEKAAKFKLDTTNIVVVSSLNFPRVFSSIGIPDGAIYDSNGNYIEYRENKESCNADLFQFITELNLKTKYNYSQKPNLNQELSKFRNLNGNPLNEVEPADYYVLLYWTVWTGRLNKDHVKVWEDLAKQNTNCKIKVIKVNLDLQEFWEESDRDKIIKAMERTEK